MACIDIDVECLQLYCGGSECGGQAVASCIEHRLLDLINHIDNAMENHIAINTELFPRRYLSNLKLPYADYKRVKTFLTVFNIPNDTTQFLVDSNFANNTEESLEEMFY